MAKEITTPGPGQMQALFVSAGNPVLSVPNGDELEAALGRARPLRRDRPLRDRHEPPRRLRAAGDDLPRARGLPAAVPWPLHDAVHPVHRGGRRAARARRARSGRSSRTIARRVGIVPSSVAGSLRLLGKVGHQALAAAPGRDAAAQRPEGRPLRPPARRPHREEAAREPARHRPRRALADRRARARRSATAAASVRLDPPEIVAEVERLRRAAAEPTDEFPLRMIGLRELRSHNSWMHNSREADARRPRATRARIHPDDAAELGIEDGARVRIASAARRDRDRGQAHRRGEARHDRRPARLGPPGGGWRRANAAGGANVNELASSDPDDLEQLAGMAHLNGIPVRLEAAARAAEPEREAVAAT